MIYSQDTPLVDVRVDCGGNIANSNIIVNRKVVFTALRWSLVIIHKYEMYSESIKVLLSKSISHIYDISTYY